MVGFVEEVSKFPSAHIEASGKGKKKENKEKALRELSDKLYPYHSCFNTPANEYANSVILISNEIAVPHMLKEVAMFVTHLEQFHQEAKKANAIQEMQAYYKRFTLKPKQLVDALVDDLKLYSERYKFTLELSTAMAQYKEEKASYTLFINDK
jgi:hypothetical protein